MNTHTPGPWAVTKDARVFSLARKEWNRTFNAEMPEFIAACGANMANARLISKAPELYEQLCALVERLERDVPRHACPGFDCAACARPNVDEARALLSELDR